MSATNQMWAVVIPIAKEVVVRDKPVQRFSQNINVDRSLSNTKPVSYK